MKILLAAQTLDFLGKLYEKHNISDNIVMWLHVIQNYYHVCHQWKRELVIKQNK